MQMSEVGKWLHSTSPGTQAQGLLGLGGFRQEWGYEMQGLSFQKAGAEQSRCLICVTLAGLELAAVKSKKQLSPQ